METPRAATENLELIYTTTASSIQKDTPILVEQANLFKDPATGEVYIQCSFRCLTDRPVKAIMVQISCADSWGEPLAGVDNHQYLDLQTGYNRVFADALPLALPDKNTREIRAWIKKLRYMDGTSVDCSPEFTQLPGPILLENHLGEPALAEQYRRSTVSAAKYVPCAQNGFWRCTCGSIHPEALAVCPDCGSALETLKAALDPQLLRGSLRAHLEKEAEEQAREQERQRTIREKAEAECKRREAELWQAQQEKAQEEERQSRRKKFQKRCLLFLAAALLVAFVIVPFASYQIANNALENGEYDYAYSLFSNLGNYFDSETMCSETRYRQAASMQEGEDYQGAYWIFKELDTYRDANERERANLMMWEAQALGAEDLSGIQALVDSVTLTSDQYEVYYSTIVLYIAAHEDPDFWISSEYRDPGVRVGKLLSLLPETYQDTALLTELFEMLTSGLYWKDIFRVHGDLMQRCWSLKFVQNLAASDRVMQYFLEGHWTGSGYYFTFYENEDGGTNTSYDLPWVAEPNGTKYFDIRDQIYLYVDADMNELAKVFRIEIVDYNVISVFCYKNNRTYTLYR